MQQDTFKKAQLIIWKQEDVKNIIKAIEEDEEVEITIKLKHKHTTIELAPSFVLDADKMLTQLQTKSDDLQKQFDEV